MKSNRCSRRVKVSPDGAGLVSRAGAALLREHDYTVSVLTAIAGLTLVGAALFARGQQRSWFAPGPFCAVYWSVAAVLPLLVFGRGYIGDKALIVVAYGTTALILGTCLALAGKSNRGTTGSGAIRQWSPLRRQLVLRTLVAAGTASALIAAVIVVQSRGFSILNAFSVSGLLSTGNRISISRYGIQPGGGSQSIAALLAITYAASLAGPFTLLGSRTRWRRTFAAAPLLSSIVYSTLTTQHSPLLLCFVMTMSGYLATRIFGDAAPPTISLKRVVKALVGAALVAGVFVGISFVRVGRSDPTIRPIIYNKIEVYAFGYLPAFSTWLDTHTTGILVNEPIGFGTSSLPGIGVLVGQNRLATRSYNDRVAIARTGQVSNIFSWWRNFLLDFGFLGGLLVCVLFGWLMGRMYRATLRGSATAAAVLACLYTILLFSITFTITTFTNVFAAMLIAILTVRYVNCKPVRSARGGGIGTVLDDRLSRAHN